MNQKGIVNTTILIVILAIIILGTGAYFIINKKSINNNQPPLNSMGVRDEAREKYADAQKKYQNDLYALFLPKWPDLKPVIEVNRNLQVALVDSSTMKFYYLLKHNPNGIVRNQGVSTFANFDWTDEDTQMLRSADLAFTALDDRIKELRISNDGHSMWPEFRNRFKSIVNDKEYISITNSLDQSVAEVEQLLRK